MRACEFVLLVVRICNKFLYRDVCRVVSKKIDEMNIESNRIESNRINIVIHRQRQQQQHHDHRWGGWNGRAREGAKSVLLLFLICTVVLIYCLIYLLMFAEAKHSTLENKRKSINDKGDDWRSKDFKKCVNGVRCG